VNKSILLSIFFLFGCSPTIFEWSEQKMLHDNSLRTFYTYLPSSIEKDMTLVIGIHGYTGNAKTFIRYGDADFNYFLEKNNFIGTFPEGKSFKLYGRTVTSFND